MDDRLKEALTKIPPELITMGMILFIMELLSTIMKKHKYTLENLSISPKDVKTQNKEQKLVNHSWNLGFAMFNGILTLQKQKDLDEYLARKQRRFSWWQKINVYCGLPALIVAALSMLLTVLSFIL